MSPRSELWQVMCPEGVFEADTETLQKWIIDGRIKPKDKVSKGNLRWIEAYRAPVLRRVFDGEPPLEETTASAVTTPDYNILQITSPAASVAQASCEIPGQAEKATPGRESAVRQALTEGNQASCQLHPESSAQFICRVCTGLFCASCPKMVAGVAICPLCGDMCKRLEEVRQHARQDDFRSSGFGLQDLRRALGFPFSHVFALLSGAALYSFLLLGGSRSGLIAWAFLFGCMSQTINHIAVGNLNRTFLPDFSSFSVWDDIIKPMFMGVGIIIVSLGPTLILSILLVWTVLAPHPQDSSVEAAPAQSQMLTEEDFDEMIDSRDEKKSEELARKIEALHPGQQMVAQIELMDQQPSSLSVFSGIMNIPGWLIFALLLSLLWAVFYYPMALAVAGYTESFTATINPLVGLDTMRRMGSTYVKAFLMYLVVQVIGIGLMIVAFIVTAPMNLLLVGNLPGTFLSGMITFYTSLVVACLLGLALFKSADRIGIITD
jgi:hypothetical protein